MLWSPTGTASLAKCPYEQQRCWTPVWTALPNPWVSFIFDWFLNMGCYCPGQGHIAVICASSQLPTATWTRKLLTGRHPAAAQGRDRAKAITDPCPCRLGSSWTRSRLPRALSSGISDRGSVLLPHRSECAGRAYAKRSTITKRYNKNLNRSDCMNTRKKLAGVIV